jgi:hypothetical protein
VTTLVRVGAIVFAIWMIVVGVLVFVGSLSDPMPEPMPLAGLVGAVPGILLTLALWAFQRRAAAAAPMATVTSNSRSTPSAAAGRERRAANPRTG